MEATIEPRDLSRGVVQYDQGSSFIVEIVVGKILPGPMVCTYGTLTRPKAGDHVLVSQSKEIVEILN